MAAVDTTADVSPESALVALYARVCADLPGASWLQSLRAEALNRVTRDGLPHRRVEAWKYTDLRNRFPAGLGLAAGVGAVGRELFDGVSAHRLHIVGGKVGVVPDGLPDGLEVISLAEALGMPSLWLRQWLQPTSDAIENLNLAFATDGALIRVARGLRVQLPVLLRTSLSVGAMAHTRNVVVLEEGAELTLVEIDDGTTHDARLASAVTAVSLERGARLRHLRVTASEGPAVVVRADKIEVAQEASYRGIVASSGAALARQQVSARLAGSGAAFAHACAYATGEGQHTDFTLEVTHEAPHTTSRILAKGVAAGNGHGVVQGRVVVKADAQKSDSHQMSRALLLTPHAEIDQKPELEIFADDVKCGHGAAIGALDASQLFYLQARGIPEAEARGMLVGAFLGEVTERLPEPYRSPVESWLSARMAAVSGGAS
jgi:Fe-S cluster assembly protein SufD